MRTPQVRITEHSPTACLLVSPVSPWGGCLESASRKSNRPKEHAWFADFTERKTPPFSCVPPVCLGSSFFLFCGSIFITNGNGRTRLEECASDLMQRLLRPPTGPDVGPLRERKLGCFPWVVDTTLQQKTFRSRPVLAPNSSRDCSPSHTRSA